MIYYRQAIDEDFDFTFKIKSNASRQLIQKIWGWDNIVQLDYHNKHFNPNNIKVVIDSNMEVGYISTLDTDSMLFIENIMIENSFQGKGIGTNVIMDTLKTALEKNKKIELQVLKINDRAKKLYEILDFETFEQTDLHYKMRYRF